MLLRILIILIFQSTLPRRERQQIRFNNLSCGIISIHAPAKGATTITAYKPLSVIFQSTLPRRERLIQIPNKDFLQAFQSTLPRRERRDISFQILHKATFQSTLPRRERLTTFVYRMGGWSFQSTLPRRERPCVRTCLGDYTWFQSTLPRRERQITIRKTCRSLAFQSTLPRRERRRTVCSCRTGQHISIHAPAKGATAILYNKFHFLCIILYILSAIT